MKEVLKCLATRSLSASLKPANLKYILIDYSILDELFLLKKLLCHTLKNKLMYEPNDDKQNYPFCRLKLLAYLKALTLFGSNQSTTQ